MKRLSTSALCRFSAGVAGVFFAGFVAIGAAWAQAGQPASVSQTPTVVKEGLRLNQQELAEAQQRLATASGVVDKSTTITRTPVYRFYNTTTGAHFYTASVSERNTVQATMPNMVYEGAAFDVSSSNSAGLSPVYRFYNQSNGVHFYTISEAEKNHLLANAPSMHLDGVVYYASQVAGPAFRPLYRFYVPSGGFHFYTVSESEKNNLIATNSNYQFEGAAYYVLGSPRAPSVSLSAPLGGGSYTAPASITLSANADDLDGWVTSVAFYSGTALLGTDTTAPYNFNWNNVPAGTYSITARATDNSGAVTTSAAVTVTVNASANQVPSVSLTAPAAGASFTAPATVGIAANAADSDGTIASVSFYNGNTLLGTDTSAPYSYSWSNVDAGTYSVTARATDNQGAVTTSAAISVIVGVANTFPTVSLTSPLPGANFTAPATVNMVANAADANGTVTQVQFYNGATLLGADTIAPYSFDWANVAAGSYSVTARVTDNNGAVTTSAAVSVTVGAANLPPIIEWYLPTDGAFIGDSPLHMEVGASDPDGSVVRVEFYDNGTLLGTVENAPYFYGTGGGLSAGLHTLYAIAYDNQGAATTSASVSVTGAESNSPPTVNLTSPLEGAVYSTLSTMQLEASATDADGSISQVEFYEGANFLGSDNTSPFTFDWSNPTQGTKQIWVRAVDDQGVSTNSSFVNVVVEPAQPSIVIIEPYTKAPTPSAMLGVPDSWLDEGWSGESRIVPTVRYADAPAVVPIRVSAVYDGGAIERVEYYSGEELIGARTEAPYDFDWVGVPSGDYLVRAKAITTDGVSRTSEPLFVTVNGAGNQCEISLVRPKGGVYRRPRGGEPPRNRHRSIPNLGPGPEINAGSTFLTNVEISGEECLGNVAEVRVWVWADSKDGNFELPSWGDWFGGTTSGALPKTIEVPFSKESYHYANHVTGFVKTPDGAIRMTGSEAIVLIDPSIGLQPAPPQSGTGNVYSASELIDLTATVVDCEDCTVRVDFYDGAVLVGSDPTAPYNLALSGLLPGTHVLTARAVDFLGEEMISQSVTVIVNVVPTVSLTSPAVGTSLVAPAAVNIAANASDADGTIASVQFFNGATQLGEPDTTVPYSYNWTNVGPGTYSITAVATDNQGATATSAAVNVIVSAVGESITYIHTDISGSPLAATNASGNVVWKENYSAYGERKLTQPGSEGQKQWFHGKEADATGLQYFGARYYDPAVGRFMGVDPVGFQEDNLHSFNRYAYGNNNPVRYLDPDGNDPDLIYMMDPGLFMEDIAPSIYGVDTSTRAGVDQVASTMQREALYEMGGMALGAAFGKVVGKVAGKFAAKAGTEGASGILETTKGAKYLGNSTGSSASGGTARAPMNPAVQEALDAVKKPSRSHGACCEIDAANKALNAGDSVRGAKMGPVKLNNSGRILPACSTCREVMKTLGIE